MCLFRCSGEDSARTPSTDAGADGGNRAPPSADAGPAGPLEWPTLDCDPLVPSYCGFPFPSNVFTAPDPATETGRRVAVGSSLLPVASGGGVTEPEPWNQLDGFSPGAALLAHFPGATEDGLPTRADIARSLEEDSPTVLIDAETGRRVLHLAELDRSGGMEQNDADRALILRPLERLENATRYIVAVREVRDSDGEPLAPSDAFAALRDDAASDEASVEERRSLYAGIFERLEAAGVERDTLQLAWDFTTASRDALTGWLVHMRDEALERVGADGPEYVIDNVDRDLDPDHIAAKIELTMRAPLFMTGPEAGASLMFGDDGLPTLNPDTSDYDVSVEVLVPLSATADEPAALIQYGHGLLGGRDEMEAAHLRSFINEYNYVLFGVDLVGMAADDLGNIAGVLGAGELHRLATMFDRLHQGFANSLVAMRLMKTRFASDADWGERIDPDRAYYYGISQGGIMGGVYMGVTTDVERGLLGVPGQPYNLLLGRSVDFDPFFQILRMSYPGFIDQQFGLTLVQMLWDRVEPTGYTPFIRDGGLPGTPPHEVLLRAAIGDHQVSNLGAHVMARSVGGQHLETGQGEVLGLTAVDAIDEGSGYVEYSFGLPPDPTCNVPPRACEDPHGKLRKLESARQQLDHFFRTGETQNFCVGGACAYPDQSGCMEGETNDGACE